MIKTVEELSQVRQQALENLQRYDCRILVCSGTGCIATGSNKIHKIFENLVKDTPGVELVFSPCCKTFSLTGAIENTGLIEVTTGSTLREIIFDIGGGLKNGAEFKAVQIGGLKGIAPQILTVPAIMAGNSVYVVLLYILADRNGKNVVKQIVAWVAAAAAKFVTLYAIVVGLICGVLSESLLASGTMKPPCSRPCLPPSAGPS